ncbi:sugar phosphate isomerase/epimerase family protein [Mucisphaera calidilacus]|uniref:Xylose isomerase-like TIM barrel n=1 Tax=Mucisphaera calidilacus TaxID=2527982 RepID=A0A518BUA2_9BACT|nr:TIM barrel protein [Mucisphaera calidilacus]QDU70575.1 Xylose isomerase-like TIM barrel [Mucisphaera calidilacus]
MAMRLGLEAGEATHDVAAELGVRGVSIDAGVLLDRGVEAAMDPLRERGLEVCQVPAFGYNPLSPDRGALDRETDRLRRLIALTPATGCRYISIGPGSFASAAFGLFDERNRRDSAVEAMASALCPLVALAAAHDVVLTVEAYLKGVISSAERFAMLRDLVGSDHLRCNLDPSSLYAGVDDCFDPMPLVERTVAGLGGWIGLVHVKEVGLEEGFHVRMGLTPVGRGHTDWAAFLRLSSAYAAADSWVIVEHCQSAEEARSSVALIRAAAAEAGVAFE